MIKKGLYALLAMLLFLGMSPAVYADSLNQNDLNSIYNDTVWYSSSAGYCGGGGEASLKGSDNIQKAFNYLAGDGLSAIQAAAVIGNLEQESGQGLDPLAQQNGSSSTTPIPNVGFGIAQWTTPSRQQGLVSLAKQEGGQPGDLAVQLDFLWQELNSGYKSVLGHLKSSTAIDDAVNQFVGPNDTSGNPVPPIYEGQRTGGFENPGDPKMSNRLQNAQDVISAYGGGTGGGAGGSSSSCVSSNCTGSAAAASSQVRQSVVCLAQQELALWKSQPGYGNNYPGFPYADTGYLKYSDNSPEEWCADFASWIYNQANYPFSGGASGGWRIPGVSAIQSLGEQNGNFHWHPQGSGYAPQPGDLAIHGPNHVNIYIDTTGGVPEYIGGDQGNGPYPGGSIVSTDNYVSDITGYVSPD